MLNVAIIGTGNISPSHITAYLKFPDRAKIVALADIYPDKAERRKKEYNLDCDIVGSHTALIGRKDIDLVSVCTPPYVHGGIAVDFLNDGKNVLIEKPMAASLEECDTVIAAAKRSGKLLSVVSQRRFTNSVWKLKKVLDSGLAGKVLHAQVDSCWWRGHSYYDLWWRGSWEKENGGCTLNHAVHHIDMLCWIKGLPKQLSAFISNVAHDNAEVEDLSSAILKYGDNSIGHLTSSVVHHGEEQKLIFQCERAKISAPWDPLASSGQADGFPYENLEYKQKLQAFYDAIPDLRFEGHAGQIGDVLDAIETNREPVVTGEQGRAAIELISAIYKSGSSGKTVDLPLRRDDPFYTLSGKLKNVPHFYKKSGAVQNFKEKSIIY
ncbi:MAG: Gfo/Idh/MocA family oxidoreductase [Clostridiales bacterium]|jgi:predicted dehydrogenase|nr:Gfo/Idh/MocA family oxidoreductase [Clostridiales bacterium]